MAFLDDHLSDTQIAIATAAVRRNQPDLFAGDGVFGTGLWQFNTPAFQGILELGLVPTGYRDVTFPFRAMAGAAVMIYLCGMYALVYRQCRSWSVSAFVAVLSSAVTYALGRSFWGVGSLASITPPALCLILTPLIMVAFLRYGRQWRLLLVFGFVGLCGNLHMVTALNLTIVLLIVYLGWRRFSPSAWPMAAGCGFCALLGGLPYAAYYVGLRWSMTPPDAQVSTAAVIEALRLGKAYVLYPDLLKSLLNWLVVIGLLLIPAAAVLSRVERFRTRNLGIWVWFAAASLFVALGLQGISQFVGSLEGKAPPVIDFVAASSLIMLPLYVLFAQALTNLFRLARRHRVWVRWACAAMAAAWLIPSENLRVARHAVYNAAASFMDEADKPLRIQEIQKGRQERIELARIAHWARDPDHTATNALFLTDDTEFRMLARRGILASADDVSFFYYMAPWRLESWSHMVRDQAAVIRPKAGAKADPHAMKRFADELAKRPEYAAVGQWYAILKASAGPEQPEPIQPVTSEGWGKHYLLYRLR